MMLVKVLDTSSLRTWMARSDCMLYGRRDVPIAGRRTAVEKCKLKE